jgi:hypothetical protein
MIILGVNPLFWPVARWCINEEAEKAAKDILPIYLKSGIVLGAFLAITLLKKYL